MASLTSIRAGIGTNLGNITSLIVYNHVPDFVEPPTAVVGVVDIIEFDTSMKRGADRYEIPVFVYVLIKLGPGERCPCAPEVYRFL